MSKDNAAPNEGEQSSESPQYGSTNGRGGLMGRWRALWGRVFPPYSECECCRVRTDCTDCADLREAGQLEHHCYRSHL